MASYMGDAMGILKKVTTTVKQVALNLTETEIKVEEATNNEPWGPHGTTMSEIAEAAYDSEKYKEIMGVIARRLQDKGENWRHVYKSLLLLEHMLKHGPMKVVHELRSNVSVIEGLSRFQYKDPKGKDHGLNVRNRAKTLVDLIQNPERIKQEREKARENKNKYGGVSRNEIRGGGGGSFGGTSGFRSGGGFGSSGSSEYDSYNSRPSSHRRNEGFSSGQGSNGRTQDQDDHGAFDNQAKVGGSSTVKVAGNSDEVLADPAPKKKLSDTKVDPSIANTFSKLAIGGPPAASQPQPPAPAATSSGSGWDAFSTPAAPASAPVPAKAADDWDAFAAAPAADQAAPVSGDAWDAFASAPGNSSPIAAQDPFADFSSAPAPAVTPAVADPFSAAPAAPMPTAFADPFAAMSSPTVAAPAIASPAAASPAKAPLPQDLFGGGPEMPMRTSGGMGMPQMMPPQPLAGGMMGGSMGMGMAGHQPSQQMGGSMGMAGMGMAGHQPPQQMGGGMSMAGMGMGMGMAGHQPPQQMGGGMGMGAGMMPPQQMAGMMGMQPGSQLGGMGMGAGMMPPQQMGGGMGMSMPQQPHYTAQHLMGAKRAPNQPGHGAPPMHGQSGVGPGIGMAPNSSVGPMLAAPAKKDPFADLSGL